VRRATRLLIALVAVLATASVSAGAAQALNPVQLENLNPGTTAWQIGQPGYHVSDDATGQIKGYASATSVNLGGTIGFNVSVNPAPQQYTIDVYRLGCYPNASGNCLGGRWMTEIGPVNGVTQPPCATDGPSGTNTGLTQCSWTGPSLSVPIWWTSGVYVAVLTNAANYQNYIPFVVRNDASTAAILYQEPVNTYEAYNNWPNYGSGDSRNGKSLYDNNSGGAPTVAGPGRTRAVKVSFDRPYAGDGGGDLTDCNGWCWEPYFIQWAEQHGYDMTYSTSVDAQENPQLLLNHKGWISVGHDEYWSKGQYDAVQAARDAGVNLGFFGGNDLYWQVRYEPNTLTGQADRTVVAYKNEPANTYATNDPVTTPSLQTVLWSEPQVNRPQQQLLGLGYDSSTATSTKNTPYSALNTSTWPYAGSGFNDGDQVPGIVGYETDHLDCYYPTPANTSYELLSNSRFVDSSAYPSYANSSLYQAPSGAWVFDAGTMSWSWALGRSGYVDPRIQQTTVNLLNGISGQSSPSLTGSSVPACADHRNLTFEGGSLTDPNPGPSAQGGDKVLGTLALDTTTPIDGTASLQVPGTANSYLDTHLTATSDTTVDVSIRLSALPTDDARIVVLGSDVLTAGNLVVRSTGVLCARYYNTWIGGSPARACTSTPLTVGTTYRLRLHEVQGTGGDGVLEAFVAPLGTPFGSAFARMTNGSWTTKVNDLTVGTTTGVALSADFDDIAINGNPLSVPAAPSGLSATAPSSSTEADLSWTDNDTNATSYQVQRSTDPSFSSGVVTFGLAGGSTSYADTSVSPATQYYYRVLAVNAAGASGPSNVASATTRTMPPASPTGLTVNWVSATENKLSWTDNETANETGETLQRARTAAFTNPVSIALAPHTTSYDDTGLAEGVYYYRVRADNGSSPSGYSNVVTGSRFKNITVEDGNPTLVDPNSGVTRNGSGLVVQETKSPLDGTYSITVPNVANAFLDQTLPASAQLDISFYLRLNSPAPTSDDRLLQLLVGNTTTVNLWVRASGQLCLKYGNAWAGGSAGAACTPSSSPLKVGTTYRIVVTEAPGNGTTSAATAASWSTNSVTATPGQPNAVTQFASATVPPTDPYYWSAAPTTLRFGATLNGTTLAATFDDIFIDQAFIPSF
jgi:hypothetical protein